MQSTNSKGMIDELSEIRKLVADIVGGPHMSVAYREQQGLQGRCDAMVRLAVNAREALDKLIAEQEKAVSQKRFDKKCHELKGCRENVKRLKEKLAALHEPAVDAALVEVLDEEAYDVLLHGLKTPAVKSAIKNGMRALKKEGMAIVFRDAAGLRIVRGGENA
jgi:hypothetical protein